MVLQKITLPCALRPYGLEFPSHVSYIAFTTVERPDMASHRTVALRSPLVSSRNKNTNWSSAVRRMVGTNDHLEFNTLDPDMYT